MQEPKPPVTKPYTFVFSWRRFMVHSTILGICLTLGLLSWYFGKPPSIRFYETTAEELLTTSIAPGIDIALDTRSSIAVKQGEILEAEFFKGNVYFDIHKNATNQLEVKVGNAIIKDFGTRFTIQIYKNGHSHIAVAEGHVKVHVASGVYQINAFEEADFDDVNISNHRLIDNRENIAPWRPR
ncbi:FecR family protein [Nitrosomonas nitrosa]|jgi:transmembrane sensor|uniref:FecR family protein n=1 Tax=Nitrosomonas nitrosa TaxID=52442 RepID=A0A1I4RI40_9PROT|nr:FecR family protein [Nitrosomonas nitrosa]MCO6433602.1 FecR domain-containing protein [Nitrosomonas nitrosa]PTQ94478.1 FecR family protein [Nitrosomonas nitrosa]CAE6498777.1 Iron dicitrate transport regulator FecR [Nitrosomonas nitrosa]SFM51919.1 FecR family protein [Nitrosomonas nitrosa]